MKKGILSALVLLVLTATVANAAPRFGASLSNAFSGGSNVGLYVTDDMWTAELGYTSDGASGTAANTLTVGAAYKMALDSQTALTAGVNYVSGPATGGSQINLQIGAERDLGSNLLAVAKANIYSTTTATTGATATNDMIKGGSLGLVYLFN